MHFVTTFPSGVKIRILLGNGYQKITLLHTFFLIPINIRNEDIAAIVLLRLAQVLAEFDIMGAVDERDVIFLFQLQSVNSTQAVVCQNNIMFFL